MNNHSFIVKNKLVLNLLFTTLLSICSTTRAGESATSSYRRMIVFGDSLSDLGTYQQIAAPMRGGQFTTNPGPIWAKVVAHKLKLNLDANRQEGFGMPLKVIGGYNYAQGGARVSTPSESTSSAKSSARPLTEQFNYFLKSDLFFKNDDLVFVQGGANDLFHQLTELQNGNITPQQAVANMRSVAFELVLLVSQMKVFGAKNLFVINMPAIEQTPRVIKFDAHTQKLIQMMVQSFNQVLASQIQDLKTGYIDFYSFDRKFNESYEKYGFKNITQPGCRVEVLPTQSSLFCSSRTLVNSKAAETYKFADAIHPSTGFSKVVGQFIYSFL